MLRLMLDGHPDLAIGPETHFIPRVRSRVSRARPEDQVSAALDAIFAADRWPDFGLDPKLLRERVQAARSRSLSDVLRVFYSTYAASQGKERWGEKTPFYVLWIPTIAELLDEAHFVHLIRDGRDAALSAMSLWWGPESAAEAARWWAKRVRAGRRDGAGRAYLEVRYEQLVERPEAELRRVCAFLKLDFDARMVDFDRRVRDQEVAVASHLVDLIPATPSTAPDRAGPREMLARQTARLSGPPDADSIGRWRTEMSADQLRSFSEIAGDLLEELGYPRS
jgi:Sulfotransferase family